MKSRILEELSKLALGQESEIRDMLTAETGLDGTDLDARAREELDAILHNYSRFHVETIDRFFQRAIRVFTREIGLSAGYRIELDSQQVLSDAVDRLLHELNEFPELQDWIATYARERVQQGKHWNLKNDILALGREINNEKFQESSDELRKIMSDKIRMQKYLEEINRIIHRFEKQLEGYAVEALKIMDREGVGISDFKYSYGIGTFFNRLANGDYSSPSARIRNSNENPDEWVTGTSEAKARVLAAYDKGLNDCLQNCLGLFDRSYRSYRSAKVVKDYFHVLGILSDIADRMHDHTQEEGIFLLSDSSLFLHGIIDGNDVPFIYEKLGNYFHHFMIDEFQDTSSLQWKNFRPLIDNSLAYNWKNLVVGDVKQSIYRWRNSNWEILSEQIPGQFSKDRLEVVGLDQNWRSNQNIVSFNNDFFSAAKEIYAEFFSQEEGERDYVLKLHQAYSDVIQNVPDLPDRTGGFVQVGMMEAESMGDWQAGVHEQVIEMLGKLQDKGQRPADIAILVRTNREGKTITDAILDHKSRHPDSPYVFDVISNDSLFLKDAPSIRVLLGAMRYLNRPDDRLNLVELMIEYSRLGRGTDNLDVIPGTDILPEEFHSNTDTLKYLTLSGLTEKLIHLFSLTSYTSEIPYLLAFQDLILDYSRNKPADINSFLGWWDENGEEKALTVSEEQDAIRVMTIHKAKGLEFSTVIIPYCSWSLDHSGFKAEVLWCAPRENPFDKLPLLPVRYGSGLKDTIFSQDYMDERFRIYMDHLNLLYVAMTRAREALIVFGRRTKKKGLSDVSYLLEQILNGAQLPSCAEGSWNPEQSLWTLGDLKFRDPPARAHEAGHTLIRKLTSHAFSGKLRLHYRGTDFFDPESEKRINRGNLMHEVFSWIRTYEDVEPAVEKIRREGIIGHEEAADMKREIRQILQTEPYRGWFDGSWQVIAERDILSRSGSLKRPDRIMLKENKLVVVDYKFGFQKTPSHKQQVKQYVDILKQMDYEHIRGFIWYVMKRELIEI